MRVSRKAEGKDKDLTGFREANLSGLLSPTASLFKVLADQCSNGVFIDSTLV